MKKSQLKQLIKEETSKLIKENKPSPKAFDLNFKDIREAFQEAYEAETGKISWVHSMDYDTVDIKKIIYIKNLVVNREELGDVSIIKTPKGWRFGY